MTFRLYVLRVLTTARQMSVRALGADQAGKKAISHDAANQEGEINHGVDPGQGTAANQIARRPNEALSRMVCCCEARRESGEWNGQHGELTMRLLRIASLCLGLAAWLTAWSAPALAAGPKTLQGMAAQADLVFRGVVERIEYVLSEPGAPEGAQIPYTFVTYRADDVYLGRVPGRSVTLRFLGGLNESTMRYLATSETPQFDVGDEDVLFVRGNSREFVPLVDEMEGRMRVLAGRMYTETGRAVELASDGTLRAGARHGFDETATTNVHGMTMRRGFGPGLVSGPSETAVTVDELGRSIRRATAGRAPAGRFANADPKARLMAPDLAAAPPPELEESETASTAAAEDDAAPRPEKIPK